MTDLHSELHKAILNYSTTDYNKLLMENRFGSDNLKKFPFRNIKILLGQSQRDGDTYFEINLDTFKSETYCTVASLGEGKITEDILKRLESELFRMLGFKRNV